MTPKQLWLARVLLRRPYWNNACDIRSLKMTWDNYQRDHKKPHFPFQPPKGKYAEPVK